MPKHVARNRLTQCWVTFPDNCYRIRLGLVRNVKVFPDCQELAQQLKSLFRQVVQALSLIRIGDN